MTNQQQLEEQFRKLVLEGDYPKQILEQLGISYTDYYELKIKCFTNKKTD